MTSRTLGALSGLVLATGCPYSEPDCPYGTFPADGATHVPLDTVIELHAFALPPDLPSLDRAVELWESDGGRVPVKIRAEGDTVYVTPVGGLRPDTAYELWGLRREELGDSRWWGALPNAETSFSFETGGTPHAIALARQYEDDKIVIAFSEPVDPVSLKAALKPNRGVEATILGALPGAEQMIEVRLDPLPDIVRMTLREGAVTLDGLPVAPTRRPLPVAIDPSWFLAYRTGEPTCD